MNNGQDNRDYGYLKVTTRPGVSEKGRSKVMIVMHAQDRDAYEKIITDDILRFSDCAVFTLKPGAAVEIVFNKDDLSEHLQNIGEMQIVVAVVTGRFLSEECFARNKEVPEAVRRSVAVLPIVVETGIIDAFNSDPVLGGMQFLDRTSADATALTYETKLKKYLDSLILTQEEVEDIRRHHAGHAFLSYRKKDRPLARKLMRILHDIRQDLAIWYDEFLTPGRHFDQEIEDTIKKSELFTMAMTPNMLERPNYVEEHEYKAAAGSGREILAVAMEDMGDADIEEVYPGLDSCLSGEDTEKIRERIDDMADRFQGYSGDRNTAEHKYYIAKGYLNGIDTEHDGERAAKLLQEAAAMREGRYSKEAYRTLVSMYLNGAGVKADRRKAKELQSDLCKYCEEVFAADFDMDDLADLINEQVNLGSLYYDDEDSEAAGIYEKTASLISEVMRQEETAGDKEFCESIYDLATLPFSRLGIIYSNAGDRQKTKTILEAEAEVEKKLQKTIRGDGDADALDMIDDEKINNENEAHREALSGNHRRGIELYLRNVELERERILLGSAGEYAEGIRMAALHGITGWYNRAAHSAILAECYEEAREYSNKALEAFRELGGSLRLLGSPDDQGELAWTYLHLAEVGRQTGDLEQLRSAVMLGSAVLEEIMKQSSADKWRGLLFELQMYMRFDPATQRDLEKMRQDPMAGFAEFLKAAFPGAVSGVNDSKEGAAAENGVAAEDGAEEVREEKANRNEAPVYGEDIPFDGEDIPFDGDDIPFDGKNIPYDSDEAAGQVEELGRRALDHDLREAESAIENGDLDEAEEYLTDIFAALNRGDYKVDKDTAGVKMVEVLELLRRVEKQRPKAKGLLGRVRNLFKRN